ncbi:uncharacterized protein [Centruroides vittatus]|uniref:uncharacterized protein n=1 Tax=Centruroides vittatus TaxID=120091 RepID=UPI003510CE50
MILKKWWKDKKDQMDMSLKINENLNGKKQLERKVITMQPICRGFLARNQIIDQIVITEQIMAAIILLNWWRSKFRGVNEEIDLQVWIQRSLNKINNRLNKKR